MCTRIRREDGLTSRERRHGAARTTSQTGKIQRGLRRGVQQTRASSTAERGSVASDPAASTSSSGQCDGGSHRPVEVYRKFAVCCAPPHAYSPSRAPSQPAHKYRRCVPVQAHTHTHKTHTHKPTSVCERQHDVYWQEGSAGGGACRYTSLARGH